MGGKKNGGKTMKHRAKKTLTLLIALGMLLSLVPALSATAYADSGSDYTFSIPSTLTVQNAGVNAAGNISVTALTSGKKLTVSAASTNGWALKSGDYSVGYSMSKTSWEFNATGSEAFSITVEDYSTKPAGTYQDTVTFTASVGSASVPVTAITLNKTATTISAGQTETLSVSSVTPDDATDQTVTWSSDNEAVATVDADGKVTAVALGTANITATANDGSGVTATCVVTVNKVVTINQSDWGSDWNPSFTKDGVTVSAGMIDPHDGNLMDGGTFSTTLGNFTKIVVTTTDSYVSGTGWSGGGSSKTWAGTPASTVSFSGEFMGMGMTPTTIVCTIVPTN